MATLRLDNISKMYGPINAIEPLSLDCPDGELVCLLGPSGSGKSTLLRIIGGFESPSGGRVLIDNSDVVSTPPEHRPTAMVFQSHALWSHMTVFENVAFGLKLRKMSKPVIAAKVKEALDMVGLQNHADRMPRQLSGGQQQRVAIARCLVLEPKILLMDEPFASLDQHLRDRLREEVRQIQRKLKITTVFVTHGQDEALSIADRIVVMSTGRIEQVGSPSEIYETPQTAFVASFIGDMNMFDCAVDAGRIRIAGLEIPTSVTAGAVTLAVRPEDIVVEGPTDDGGVLVTRTVNLGSFIKVESQADDGTMVRIQVPKSADIAEGQTLSIRVSRFALFREGKVISTVPS
ncbi:MULTISPECIES: ABC transporter ATP-binding protein [unclassified Rhizobium]